jgi:hypothetical protein
MRRVVVTAAAVAALAGCVTPTSFTGEAKVKNGVKGCQAACEGWGMDLAGMVKMGEYSDGCVCKVKERLAPSAAVSPAQERAVAELLSAAAASAQQASVQQHVQQQEEAERPPRPHAYVPTP